MNLSRSSTKDYFLTILQLILYFGKHASHIALNIFWPAHLFYQRCLFCQNVTDFTVLIDRSHNICVWKCFTTTENIPPDVLDNITSRSLFLYPKKSDNSVKPVHLFSAGQVFKHRPQFIHFSSFTFGWRKPSSFSTIVMAETWHTEKQAEHP